MQTSVKEFFGLELFSRTLTDGCFCHSVFRTTAGQDICLFSRCKVFELTLENSKLAKRVSYKNVCRTQSNIYDGAFYA